MTSSNNPGPGVDAQGRPVIDPTENVKALTEAAVNRLDDLRNTETQHSKDLISIITKNIEEMAKLRADYDDRLRDAESKRIDAIRAVDVGAVQRAAEVSAAQAQTLAIQVACVSADTPILCADLVWRPAGDLQVGDALVAFNEDIEPNHPGAVASHGRKYARAIVTANSLKEDELVVVETAAGSVRCNPQHPWLAKRPRSKVPKWDWRAASDLEPGDLVMRLFDVWETDRSYEAGWLSGIMDGEGCLSRGNSTTGNMKITVVQAEGPTSDEIARIMKAREPATTIRNVNEDNRKPKSYFTITTLAGVMKMLGSVRPKRLLVKSDLVWEGKHLSAPNRAVEVLSVESCGTGTIASLTTDTHTYIADGFAMHNTSAETLRAQVAAAATASATALGAALDPIQKDIADLRRAQYEAQGVKAQTVDSRSSNGAILTAIGIASTFIIMIIAVVGFIIART